MHLDDVLRRNHWLCIEVVRRLRLHHGFLKRLVLYLHLILDLLEFLLVATLFFHKLELLVFEVVRLCSIVSAIFLLPERAGQQSRSS